jgi:hypothetical protein
MVQILNLSEKANQEWLTLELDHKPMPVIDLSSLGLSDADLEIASGILDETGRLREVSPDADLKGQGTSSLPSPSLSASTAFLWRWVATFLSPRKSHAHFAFDYGFGGPQNYTSLQALAKTIADNFPQSEWYGTMRVMLFISRFSDMDGQREMRLSPCGRD